MSYFKSTMLSDHTGATAQIGSFGALKVSNPHDQIVHVFTHKLDTNRDFTTTTTGTGNIESQYNRSLLHCNTGTTGTAQIITKHVLRYKPGSDIEVLFTAQWEGTTTTNEYAYIGLLDNHDGVFVGYNAGNFIVGYRSTYNDGGSAIGSGTVADVTQDVSSVLTANSIDPKSGIYRFRIRFGYLGVGDIVYEIKPPGTSEWLILHRFETDGALDKKTHIGAPTLPMSVEMSSASNNHHIYSGSWSGKTHHTNLDNIESKPFFSSGSKTVVGSTTPQYIVSFKCRTTDNGLGYPNEVISQLMSAEFATGSEGLYAFQIYQFASGTLDGTFANIDADSVLQEATDTTTAAASGTLIYETFLAVQSSGTGVGTASLDFKRQAFYARPGDEFAIYKTELIGGAGNDITAWSIGYVDLY